MWNKIWQCGQQHSAFLLFSLYGSYFPYYWHFMPPRHCKITQLGHLFFLGSLGFLCALNLSGLAKSTKNPYSPYLTTCPCFNSAKLHRDFLSFSSLKGSKFNLTFVLYLSNQQKKPLREMLHLHGFIAILCWLVLSKTSRFYYDKPFLLNEKRKKRTI